MNSQRDEAERFFKRVIWSVAKGNAVPIRIQSHCPEDPRWVSNGWGSKNVARKRPEECCFTAQEATQWALGKKHGRLATVPSGSNIVVKLRDTEAVDLRLVDPVACRLAFFEMVPTLVVAHQETGTLHAVWLLRFPTVAARSLSDRLARRLKGTVAKRIPVPGTVAHDGQYELIETGLERDASDLEASLSRA